MLAELLERFTEIRGAVLTDDEGNPVDFARRPTAIDTLDLQIVGAQLERCIAPVDASCAKLGLSTRADVVILEGDEGTILGCTLVEGMFVLAAIVAPTENIERLSATFDDVARKLTMLLES